MNTRNYVKSGVCIGHRPISM